MVLETITQQYPAQAASMSPEVTCITNDAAQKLGSNDQTAIPTSAMDCGRPLPLPLSAQSIFNHGFGAAPTLAHRSSLGATASRYHHVPFAPTGPFQICSLALSAVLSPSVTSLMLVSF